MKRNLVIFLAFLLAGAAVAYVAATLSRGGGVLEPEPLVEESYYPAVGDSAAAAAAAADSVATEEAGVPE